MLRSKELPEAFKKKIVAGHESKGFKDHIVLKWRTSTIFRSFRISTMKYVFTLL
uniref:Uncharacterized protein n=1 Tax=Fundulus heteroclitus TaxID=8078 RepID=A0A3Q2QSD5_FUNHE